MDRAELLPTTGLEEGEASQQDETSPRVRPRRSLWRIASAAAAAGTAIAVLAGAAGVVAMRSQGRAAPALTKAASTHGDALEQKWPWDGAAAPSVVTGNDEDACPAGYERITDVATCRVAMNFLEGGDPDHYGGDASEHDYPKGCYLCKDAKGCEDGVWFNSHQTGSKKKGAKPLCQQGFSVKTGATVFVGDSDVDYWHSFATSAPDSYNVGIGGNTCNDVKKEIDFILDKFKPKTVILVCGENDLAGGAKVSTTYKRWKSVVDKIRASGVRIVQVGTKPEKSTKDLHKKYEEYDKKVREYAVSLAKEDVLPPITFVDSYKAFVEKGNSDSYYDPSEKPDYLHLGSKGYDLWNAWLKLALSNTFACVVWDGDKCEEQASPINVMASSANECPTGYEKITTEAECNAAVGLVTVKNNNFNGAETAADFPAGCYLCKDVENCLDGTWLNKEATGKAVKGARLYCKLKL